MVIDIRMKTVSTTSYLHIHWILYRLRLVFNLIYQFSSKEIQEFFKVLCVQKSMFLVTKETSSTKPPPPPPPKKKRPKDVSGYKIDLWVFPKMNHWIYLHCYSFFRLCKHGPIVWDSVSEQIPLATYHFLSAPSDVHLLYSNYWKD